MLSILCSVQAPQYHFILILFDCIFNSCYYKRLFKDSFRVWGLRKRDRSSKTTTNPVPNNLCSQ